jgi:hypothetical protein
VAVVCNFHPPTRRMSREPPPPPAPTPGRRQRRRGRVAVADGRERVIVRVEQLVLENLFGSVCNLNSAIRLLLCRAAR